MFEGMVREPVDIYQMPVVDQAHIADFGAQITIGDLHGNAVKLLFLLVKHGIASNLTVANYNRLVELYRTFSTRDQYILRNEPPELMREKLLEFNTILDTIQFNTSATIRLIGDELADRGSNDFLTLLVLDKLHQQAVPVDILISNHSVEFIQAYETQENFYAPMLTYEHASSMENMQRLIGRGIVSQAEIMRIVNNAYKSKLKAIAYTLSADGMDITIYSHAGIGLNTIKELAVKLKVPYLDDTACHLAQTIDAINTVFQTYVQANTVHTLYSIEAMEAGYGGNVPRINDPFAFLMWNRKHDDIKRPVAQKGYKLGFVHGHDMSDQTNEHICNLDNNLGKYNTHAGYEDALFSNQGEYTILYSHEEQLPTLIFERNIKLQLAILFDKKNNLLTDGHETAGKKAGELYERLSQLYKQYVSADIDRPEFIRQSTIAIQMARPILEEHRGWKQLLGNLGLAIIGLGVIYIAAGLINMAVTGNFLFFKTDASAKLDALQNILDQTIPPVV